MVLIASEHEVAPKDLIEAFFDALENKTSHIGTLQITLRTVTNDSAIFLVTKGKNVIWQFPLNIESLRDPHVRASITNIPLPEKKQLAQHLNRDLKINEVKVGMKGIQLTAKIIEIPPARHVFTRWGSEASVSNVKLADDTGTIRLGLWNDQIDRVQLDDEVALKNCSVTRFAGEPQLRLGRKSTMTVITPHN